MQAFAYKQNCENFNIGTIKDTTFFRGFTEDIIIINSLASNIH